MIEVMQHYIVKYSVFETLVSKVANVSLVFC